MPKARAYSRYLFTERHKKQYVLTKTKLVVGFTLSLMGSVFVGSYFERYGPIIIHQAITAARAIFSDTPADEPAKVAGVEPAPIADPPETAAPAAAETQEEMSTLENRVKSIQVNSKKANASPSPASAAENN